MIASPRPIAIYCHGLIVGYAVEPEILSGVRIAAGWIPLGWSLKSGKTVAFDQTGHACWQQLVVHREGIDRSLPSERPRWRVHRLTDAEIELEYSTPHRPGILTMASRFLTGQPMRRATETSPVRNLAVDVFQHGHLIAHIESPAFPGFGEIIGIWHSVGDNPTFDVTNEQHSGALRIDQLSFERWEQSLPRSNSPGAYVRAIDPDVVQFHVESFEHGIITLDADDFSGKST